MGEGFGNHRSRFEGVRRSVAEDRLQRRKHRLNESERVNTKLLHTSKTKIISHVHTPPAKKQRRLKCDILIDIHTEDVKNRRTTTIRKLKLKIVNSTISLDCCEQLFLKRRRQKLLRCL